MCVPPSPPFPFSLVFLIESNVLGFSFLIFSFIESNSYNWGLGGAGGRGGGPFSFLRYPFFFSLTESNVLGVACLLQEYISTKFDSYVPNSSCIFTCT